MEVFSLNATLFWFILGVVFLVLEALTPGLFLLFFGLGAWAAGGGGLAGLGLMAQGLIFLTVSLVSLVIFRKKLQAFFAARPSRSEDFDDPVVSGQYLGREVTVIGATAPGRSGLVELNCTNWNARSEGGVLEPGDQVRVLRREGLTLIVEKIPTFPAG